MDGALCIPNRSYHTNLVGKYDIQLSIYQVEKILFLCGRRGRRVGLGESLSPAPDGLAPQVAVLLNLGLLFERVDDPVGEQVPPSECRRQMMVVGLENLGRFVNVAEALARLNDVRAIYQNYLSLASSGRVFADSTYIMCHLAAVLRISQIH